MKAFTATDVKRTRITAATRMPITLSLFIHTWLLQPTVWNMLQNPWVRWKNTAMNQMM